MKYFIEYKRISILILSLMVGNAILLHAQEGGRPILEAKPTVQLNQDQLKAVNGVFQSPRNADMYLQITTSEKGVTGKMLWNNNQIKFTPESDSTFFSKDANEGNPMRITFRKDFLGTFTQLSLGNNDQWKRVYDYKPVVKVEMPHTPEQLKPFEGLYQPQNGFLRYIHLSVKDNQLFYVQQGSPNGLIFTPESELSFYMKEQILNSLLFAKDSAGAISQVTINKRDVWKKITPAKYTIDQLKVFEGKYQSKDDEDNILQLIAKNNQLIVKQLWDKKEITLTPQTDIYFYNPEQLFSLVFVKDKDGEYSSIKILGISVFTKMK